MIGYEVIMVLWQFGKFLCQNSLSLNKKNSDGDLHVKVAIAINA